MGVSDQLRLGVEYHQANRLAEAEQIYRAILAQDPDHPKALELLGLIAHQSGQAEVAVTLIARAVSINPRDPEPLVNLAEAYRSLGQLHEAVDALKRAIALSPLPQAYYNLGLALTDLGREADAIVAYRTAARLDPHHAKAHNNLGMLLKDNEPAQAVAEFRAAVQIEPDVPDFWTNLGNALASSGEVDAAADAARRAIQLNPDAADYHINLAAIQQRQGLVDEAMAESREAMRLDPASAAAHSNLLYTMLFQSDVDPATVLREHHHWDVRHAIPLASNQSYRSDRTPERKLRVGYVSRDLKFHPAGRCLLPILEHHDREHVQAILYADVPKLDALSRRMQSVAAWIDISRMTDAALAERIREDEIDILVDLTLHSARNRLLVFARKSAPVQVTYLGYPGTAGLTAVDYRLSDDRLDPAGVDAFYSEQTVRLPGSYWCYQPPPEQFDCGVSELPALQTKVITFGSLNHSLKINERTLSTWRQLLLQLPSTRLLLHCESGARQASIQESFAAAGVDAGRLEFVGVQPYDQYLRTCQRIDIGLDSFPYTGGVTTCEMLWMGVPVVTFAGVYALHRGGASILASVGLDELIAKTTEQYIAIARGLAGDIERLRALRSGMRDRLRNSQLLDGARAAADIEAAYRQMWTTWCKQ